jgi:hypothetical protein
VTPAGLFFVPDEASVFGGEAPNCGRVVLGFGAFLLELRLEVELLFEARVSDVVDGALDVGVGAGRSGGELCFTGLVRPPRGLVAVI